MNQVSYIIPLDYTNHKVGDVVGFLPQQSSDSNWNFWFQIGTSIAEAVALAAIPFTGGASLVASLGFAAARTGASLAAGEFNWISTALDFAIPSVGYGIKAVGNVVKVADLAKAGVSIDVAKSIVSNGASASSVKILSSKLDDLYETALMNTLDSSVTKDALAKGFLEIGSSKAMSGPEFSTLIDRINGFEKYNSELLKRFVKDLNTGNEAVKETLAWLVDAADDFGLGTDASRFLEKAFKSLSTGDYARFSSSIDALDLNRQFLFAQDTALQMARIPGGSFDLAKQMYQASIDIPWGQSLKIGSPSLTMASADVATKNIVNTVDDIIRSSNPTVYDDWVSIASNLNTKNTETYIKAATAFLMSVGDEASMVAIKKLSVFTTQLRSLLSSAKTSKKFLTSMKNIVKAKSKVSNGSLDIFKADKALYNQFKNEGIYKAVSGRNFYNAVARRIQWLKPGDAARDITTPVYNKLKSVIKNSKALKKLKAIFSKMELIEDAFVKVGGTIIDSSWILGYRVIEQKGPRALIQIQFVPSATYCKPPVFVWMNDVELARFLSSSSKGQYYIDNIAMARNGTKGSLLSSLTFKLGISAGTSFGLIPIQLLRSVRSIITTATATVSEIVENGFGSFAENYFSGFGEKIVTNIITRVGRIGGTVAGTGFSNGIIRRETQRTINLFVGRGIKNTLSGEKFMNNFSFKTVASAYLTGANSAAKGKLGSIYGRGMGSSSAVLQRQAFTRYTNIFTGTARSFTGPKVSTKLNWLNLPKVG